MNLWRTPRLFRESAMALDGCGDRYRCREPLMITSRAVSALITGVSSREAPSTTTMQGPWEYYRRSDGLF